MENPSWVAFFCFVVVVDGWGRGPTLTEGELRQAKAYNATRLQCIHSVEAYRRGGEKAYRRKAPEREQVHSVEASTRYSFAIVDQSGSKDGRTQKPGNPVTRIAINF